MPQPTRKTLAAAPSVSPDKTTLEPEANRAPTGLAAFILGAEALEQAAELELPGQEFAVFLDIRARRLRRKLDCPGTQRFRRGGAT